MSKRKVAGLEAWIGSGGKKPKSPGVNSRDRSDKSKTMAEEQRHMETSERLSKYSTKLILINTTSWTN